MSFHIINPTTGEKLRSFNQMTPQQVQGILQQVAAAQFAWGRRPFRERAQCLKAAHGVLLKNKEEYARLMAAEMGKPLPQGVAEVEKCAWVCEYYAEHGEEFLRPQPVATEAKKSFVAFRPLGVVLAVMPWNFPFWQVLRFAAPALMAGNGAVLKHASNVFGSALALEKIFREAGFPEQRS
jgi:succinate-semialdehyde dehydrogenase/glutarate-semialdehyde dehydrogenase